MKASELRDKTVEQLQQIELELRKELFEVRSEYNMSKSVEKPHRLKTLRKDIARVLTVMSEKELLELGDIS